jgi:predicted transcriptional regulator
MYGIPDAIRPLSGAEEAVMLAVWASRAPITRQEIARHLEQKTWADATLLNFLYRLEEKGWVKSSKERNRNVYTPCVTRRAYGVWCMRERLGTLFGGDLAAAVYALTSESGSGRAQLESARRVLDEKLSETEEYDLYDPYG